MVLLEENNKFSYHLITCLVHANQETEKLLPLSRALHLSFCSSAEFVCSQYFSCVDTRLILPEYLVVKCSLLKIYAK